MNYEPENRIPWLFTDFDNIKDFPWLFPDHGNPDYQQVKSPGFEG